MCVRSVSVEREISVNRLLSLFIHTNRASTRLLWALSKTRDFIFVSCLLLVISYHYYHPRRLARSLFLWVCWSCPQTHMDIPCEKQQQTKSFVHKARSLSSSWYHLALNSALWDVSQMIKETKPVICVLVVHNGVLFLLSFVIISSWSRLFSLKEARGAIL